MASTITYGGIPLLLPDRNGELHRWLERYFDPENLNVSAECPTWMAGQRIQSRKNEQTLTTLPIPNYPPAPPPRVNALYWPTGATRWAKGYFLADTAGKDAIMKQLATPKALYLRIGEKEAKSKAYIAPEMWLLPPRLLTGMPASKDYSQLWLLPLVDERWWWQYRHMNETAMDNTITWDSLITRISTALGGLAITCSPSLIAAAYLIPDWVQLNRMRENAAMILDAVAASIGRRVVRTPAGNVYLYSAANAAALVTDQYRRLGGFYAGGNHAVN